MAKKKRATFEVVASTGTKKKKGTCDTCKYNRYSVETAEGKKGVCEIGSALRGHSQLPPENTCEAWLKRTV